MSVTEQLPTIQKAERAIELKGSMFTLPVLKLLHTDMDAVARELGDKVRLAPQFFENAPVVIDLGALKGQTTGTENLALLIGMLRSQGMIPVGIRGGQAADKEIAISLELAVLPDEKPDRPKASRKNNGDLPSRPPPETSKQKAPEAPAPALESTIINTPVRSGQRVYANNGDLIVLAAVSSGAELLATGNIHVYGRLRGRALAGVQGNAETRIFCRALDAELLSIAGQYRVSDDISQDHKGKSVQIYMQNGRMIVETL